VHGPRFSLLAAIAGAWTLLVSSVSSLLAGASWPDVSAGHVVEIAVALMASGFLYLVRKWIAKQEDADRKVMDTISEEIDRRQKFEREVAGSLGLIMGHLGLHREDSDPGLLVAPGEERRAMSERRIIADRRRERQ